MRREIALFLRHVDRGSVEGGDEEDSDVGVDIVSRYGTYRSSASFYTRAGQGREDSASFVSRFFF